MARRWRGLDRAGGGEDRERPYAARLADAAANASAAAPLPRAPATSPPTTSNQATDLR